MIYVSHSINEILNLTQKIAIINNGTLLAYGNFHDILVTDKVLSLAHSLGIENVISVRLTEKSDSHCLGSYPGNSLYLPFTELPVGSSFSVVVPASNIAVSRNFVEGVTIQNQIPGTVTSITITNHRALVTVDTGQPLIAEITEKALLDLNIKNDDRVYCLIKTQAIRHLGGISDQASS
jgi:molybdate transport system ATP-binding protein